MQLASLLVATVSGRTELNARGVLRISFQFDELTAFMRFAGGHLRVKVRASTALNQRGWPC
jgi:hypothetical protein